MHRGPSLFLAIAAATAAGCAAEVTPGNELMGRWSFIGSPNEQWQFLEDLTYLRTGTFPQRGQFSVEADRLHLVPEGARPISYDYAVTRDHFLGLALHAESSTTGRLGTFRGGYTYEDDGESVDRSLTLRADGSAHITRHTVAPGRDELVEGEGTWVDPNLPNNSFFVQVTYTLPDGSTATDDLTLWHIGNAVGQLAYQRITF